MHPKVRSLLLGAGIFGTTALLAPVAHAINISLADVQSGVAKVSGGKAAANSTITWEGGNVVTANKNGGFNFQGVVPSDCVGTLSDGVITIDVALTNCTPVSEGGGVLKTGQTTCYDSDGNVIACAGTGQDGELQEGTARSYTDNGDGTITDNATGLVWEKLTDDGTIHDWDNTYTWADAFAVKIAALNTVPCFAGNCDWRLPNLNELQTLADYGRVGPAIDPAFNSGGSFTQSSVYWSSTTYAPVPAIAWGVCFDNGGVCAGGKTGFDFFFVRAVAGGS